MSDNSFLINNEKEIRNPTDRFIFWIGIGLLIFLLAIVILIETFLKKNISPLGYEVIKVILCVSGSLVFSQIPGLLNISLPIGVKAAGGIAFGILIYFYTPNYLSPKNSTNVPIKSVPPKNKKLRIVVLKSGDEEYSYNILDEFLNTIRDTLKYTNYQLETPTVLTGRSESYNDSSIKKDFHYTVESIFKRDTFDYYVTIGSASSKALQDYVITNKRFIKHIFLGVTDPVAIGLVNTTAPNRRDIDHINVAGVAYCGNYEELPNKIHQLFPSKKLCYIYDASIIEDGNIAQRLSQTDLISNQILTIKKLNHPPTIGDFADRSLVYFGWSTFDNVFANNYKLINEVKNIISTTSTHVEFGLVPIAVTTDDELIGDMGAKIVYQNLIEHTPLQNIDILIPPWETYVNVRLAGKLNIEDKYIQSCDHKF